ncbi:MAG: PD-(D/E)XK nuclease family protein, partial [Candidatus Omnitrophica bacterium]|nr:PD-(D/E)XK nuclease family protein [Candidatus Omnitrophota bacterium]
MKKVEEPERYGRPACHAVEDGVLQYVSPSQVKTFDTVTGGCKRAWYYDKVMHFPRRQFKSQDVGKATHASIEHYLTTGENVLGPIALVGIEHLPVPKSLLKIEWPIYFIRPEQPLPGLGVKAPPAIPPELLRELEEQPRLVVQGLGSGDEGIPVIGFVDLIDLNDLARGRVVVIDHKTSSSIARYAKTAKELEKDPQSAAYLQFARLKWPGMSVYEFRHYYYQTHGARRFEPVVAPFNAGQVEAAWGRFCSTVHEMEEVAGMANPTDVPANDEACGSYGGCSFAGMCPASPGRRFHMSLMDRVKALNTAANAPETTSAPTSAPGGIPVKNAQAGQKYTLALGGADPLEFMAYTLNFCILQDAKGQVVRLPADTVVYPLGTPAAPA